MTDTEELVDAVRGVQGPRVSSIFSYSPIYTAEYIKVDRLRKVLHLIASISSFISPQDQAYHIALHLYALPIDLKLGANISTASRMSPRMS